MKKIVIIFTLFMMVFATSHSEAAISEKSRQNSNYKKVKKSRIKRSSKVKKKKSTRLRARKKVRKKTKVQKRRVGKNKIKNLKKESLREKLPVELIRKTIMALRLPRINRINTLRGMDKQVVESLKAIAFDKNESLQVRWRALTSLGEAYPKEAQKPMSKALASKEWYMRNAGLIGMTHVSRSRSLSWAGKLLSDPALVVRTAAVKTISKLKGSRYEAQLWRKLYSKENFSRGKSLWIRKHIVRALSQFARSGREAHFVKILSDSDSSLYPHAIAGLEKIRGTETTSHLSSLKDKRNSWMRWWKGQRAPKVRM